MIGSGSIICRAGLGGRCRSCGSRLGSNALRPQIFKHLGINQSTDDKNRYNHKSCYKRSRTAFFCSLLDVLFALFFAAAGFHSRRRRCILHRSTLCRT